MGMTQTSQQRDKSEGGSRNVVPHQPHITVTRRQASHSVDTDQLTEIETCTEDPSLARTECDGASVSDITHHARNDEEKVEEKVERTLLPSHSDKEKVTKSAQKLKKKVEF